MPKTRKTRSGKKRRASKQQKQDSPLYFRWPVLLTAILVLVVIVYSPTLTADFVGFDDDELILDRQYHFEYTPWKIFQFSMFNPHYKPVTYFTWLMEYYLSGNAAWMHHLNNLLLHLLNTFLVFVLIRRLAKKFDSTRGKAIPLALVSALIFGIHPMHVESVAWVVERKDVLYAATFLGSLWCYLKYLDNKQYKWLILSAAGFLLSVFSKSPAIVLPAMLFLLDWVYRRSWGMHLVKEKIPHFAIMLLALYMFGFFDLGTSEGAIGAVAERGVVADTEYLRHLPATYVKILVASMQGLLWYVHSWLPVKLSLAYPRDQIIGSFGIMIHLLPWVLAALVILHWRKRKQWPLLAFTNAFFLIAIAPAMIRVSPGFGIFLSDRYTYLALFGISFLIALLVLRIKSRPLLYTVLTVVSLIFVAQSYSRALAWQNTEALWTSTIKKFPRIDFAYTNRGMHYLQEERYDEALADLNKAVELSPNSENYLNRGNILRRLERYDDAVADFTLCIQIDPDNEHCWNNRGGTYIDLRQFDKAIRDFNQVVAMKPRFIMAFINRAITYIHMGQLDNALAEFTKAEELNPHYPAIFKNRAMIYFKQGRTDLAIADFRKYLQAFPDDHQNWANLGTVYQINGDHKNALQCFNRAISLENTQAYLLKRAQTYEALGDQASAASDRAAANR